MKSLLFFCALLSFSSFSFAGIAWVSSSGSYSPNSTITLIADSSTKYDGISVDFTSNIDGSFSYAGQNLTMVTSSAVAAGTPLTFYWDFSHQIGGASSPSTRAAALFRMQDPTSVTVDALMYGGESSLRDYWGSNTTGPYVTNSNGGVLTFQDIWVRDPSTSHFYGRGPTSAVFDSFVDDNTVRITGGNTNSSLASIDADEIPGDTISGDDNTVIDIVSSYSDNGFNFSGWRFTVTPNETLPANTTFLFTFEGLEIGPAIPFVVPEPSRLLLSAMGLSALILRRRR